MCKPYLEEVLDLDALHEELAQGYVKRQLHPTEPLAILNYTDPCTFEGHWNDTTRACRGLIYNTATTEVVARPFPKFHNWHEWESGRLGDIPFRMDQRTLVLDKLDGSLGIAYVRPSDGQLAIATRGSFISEQATHATEMVRNTRWTAEDAWPPFTADDLCPCCTYLFEIIYPENRIVVNYGDRDELVFLGTVEKDSGVFMPAAEGHSTPYMPAELLGKGETMAEALSSAPLDRDNVEGVVLVTDEGGMIKLKQQDYVELFKILYGLNAHVVWEHWRDDADPWEWAYNQPEEVADWVLSVMRRLADQAQEIIGAAMEEHHDIMAALEGRENPEGVPCNKLYFQELRSKPRRVHECYIFCVRDNNWTKLANWYIMRAIEPSGKEKFRGDRDSDSD